MAVRPLRVMIVEDDARLAAKLAGEVRAMGDVVVGPFDDAHDALMHIDDVQAAILDVRIQDESVFFVADSLRRYDVPFVFLSDSGYRDMPARFDGQAVYGKKRHAASLLNDLHRQHGRLVDCEEDDLRAVVLDMLRHARAIMPDHPSAERLVEAALRRAVVQVCADETGSNSRAWLMNLLEVEHARRGRLHLQ